MLNLVALFAASLAPFQPQSPPGQDLQDSRERDSQETPEIVVTGTLEESGVPVVPLNATGSRDVLGPEDIQRVGARDMNDLIQYLPAVSTRPYNGGEAAAPSFSMRGLPDDGLTEYVLVAIDGVPASPLPYGWTAFSFLPLMTEQVYAIDLVRGGYSVRYSPNTVGGVLNLITAPIPSEETYRLRTTLGSHGYSSTQLSAGDDDGRFGYLVTLGDRHGDGYRVQADFQQTSLDTKLRWTFAPEDWLALRVSYFDDEHRVPGGLTQAQFAQDPFGNARRENVFRGARTVADVVRHVGDEQEYFEYYGWVSHTHRNLKRTDPVFGGPPTNFRVSDDDAFNAAFGLRSTQEIQALGGEHEIHWGVRAAEEYLPHRNTVTTPLPAGAPTMISDIDDRLTALSLHADDTLHPTEDLTLVLGARAEWIPTFVAEDQVTGEKEEDDMFAVLPGASASYALSDQFALFANYQRSFRAPQVWGLDTSVADPAQSLDFENGASWEAGVRADTRAGITGSVAVWDTQFEDVAFFNPAGLYENVGDIDAQGVDLVLGADLGEWSSALAGFSVHGSMTWQDSELVNAANPANDGNETPYAWEEKAAWSLQYESASRWLFTLGGVHVGESFSDEANTTAENANGNLGLNEARTIWDAQVGREFALGEKLAGRWSLGATNVFDEDWLVHSRGGFFGGGKVAGPPRQVYFGLQASF